jgi:hypothetical protein
MTTFTQDQWIILALVFVLGLLIGMFLTAGGRRKWKTRYNEEVTKRKSLEKEHHDREAHWTSREKEWRERDSLRDAGARDRGAATPRDVDGDGVRNRDDHRPTDSRRI